MAGTRNGDRSETRLTARATLRTRAVHVGEGEGTATRPLAAPIVQSAAYAMRDPLLAETDQLVEPPQPSYGRYGLPNTHALERAIADLEGAEAAYTTASGMAAAALLFLTTLNAGDHVVASADCYGETALLLRQELARFGVRSSFVDAGDPAAVAAALTPATRLLYIETISNPALKLAALSPLAEIAHAADVLLVVDNTLATPVLCRPLEHGADVIVHSVTKFLGGHHDLLAGVVAGSRSLVDCLRRSGGLFGPTLGPMDAWLALRGIRTLPLRLAWMSDTALSLATFLDQHPAVVRVRYPGLSSYPQADLARQLLPLGAGAVLTFDLAGPAAMEQLIHLLRLVVYAPSLGGPTTTVCYAPRSFVTDHGSNPPRRAWQSATLRVSVGLEAPDDLIADFAQALDRLPAPPPNAHREEQA